MEKKRNTAFAVWCALAALCFVYGVIVGRAGAGTGFFLFWPALGAVCLLCAAETRRGIWRRLPAAARRALKALFCAGLCVFLLAEGCILSGFRCQGEPGLDYIIVLGAQVSDRGPSVVLRYRLKEAIAYLNENPDTLCVVSGGQGRNEPYPEADIMANYLRRYGIAEERIVRESLSLTTAENLRNSRALIPEGASVGLVTNDFHIFRALLIAGDEGYENVCGIAADSVPLYLPNNMAREFFALGKYLATSIL